MSDKDTFGVVTLIMGIVALIGCWIPFLNIISMIIAISGLIIGICSIVKFLKKKCRNCALAIIGMILSVITICLGFSINNSISDTFNKDSKPISKNSQPINSDNSESTNNEFKLGDVISFDDKEVTVTNLTRNYNTGNEFSKPKDGKEFVKVTVEIKNKSKSDISYNTFDFKIKTDNGVLESTSWSASPDDSLGSGKLAENGKIKGSMVFEVPKGDKKLSLRYSPSFWSNKNIEIKL
ncbi:MAG: DUF4352 domain-containing protein [Clostridia bacterium]|nr:DUF4352 domain-containing protein [Clostridia bacterium]